MEKFQAPCCRKLSVRIPIPPPLDTPLGKRSINFLYEFDVVPIRRGGGRNNMGVKFSCIIYYAGDCSKSICLVRDFSKAIVIQVVKRSIITLMIRKPFLRK